VLRAEAFLADGDGALVKQLGLVRTTELVEQAGIVLEAPYQVRVLRPERRLPDRDSALKQ
jgi:hypothetical protein